MAIIFSEHFTVRLRMRNIPEFVAKDIYLRAHRRYFDVETNLFIAVRKIPLFGKRRILMIAYKKQDRTVLFVTIHPLKPNQMRNRIDSGRWKAVEE
jgi:hypothetical protein